MTSLGRQLCRLAISASRKWWKVLFQTIDHCSLRWLCCWATCWMLQDMDNMEASCVFYVKVSMCTHLEHSKTSLLTVNNTGIVRLTVQHYLIVSVSFMYYPGDSLRQTWADIITLKQWPIYSWQWYDFGCHTLQFIPAKKQTTTDRHIPHFGAVGNPCKLQLCASGFILSITHMLATNYSILTWSLVYNPQDFPLLFVINFLFNLTPAHENYSTTPARSERIRIQPIDRCFMEYVT